MRIPEIIHVSLAQNRFLQPIILSSGFAWIPLLGNLGSNVIINLTPRYHISSKVVTLKMHILRVN